MNIGVRMSFQINVFVFLIYNSIGATAGSCESSIFNIFYRIHRIEPIYISLVGRSSEANSHNKNTREQSQNGAKIE